MIPLSRIRDMAPREVDELLAPLFGYTLAEAPLQEREVLIDLICETLLGDIGSVRARRERSEAA